MELQFIKQNDKIGIIFNEDGLTSDILFISLNKSKKLVEQTTLALQKENDRASVFNSDNTFAYVKQTNKMFLLTISITENFAMGKYLRHRQMKRIISQITRLLK